MRAAPGRHEYNVEFAEPGFETISVVDPAGIIRTGALSLGVLGINEIEYRFEAPAEASAGEAFTVTVNLMEKGGRWVDNYTGTFRISSTDSKAALPADHQFAVGSGTYTFTNALTLRTPGHQTVTVTDTAHPYLKNSFNVRVNAAKK